MEGYVMSQTPTQINNVILTETAAEAVTDLLSKKNLENHALRVFVQSGGCSGFQYGMALEGEPQASDFRTEQFGVQVVVDENSLEYLSGATIDYVEDIMGSGFKIENPNSVASCGCGNSFRTKDQRGKAASCH